MQFIKPVLFLALFLLFATLIAIADVASAGGRTQSVMNARPTGYVQPHLHDAHKPHNAVWSRPAWEVERYGNNDFARDNDAIMARFEQRGLITGYDRDDRRADLPVIKVSDLFLRLADRDKRRVLMSFDHAMRSAQKPVLRVQRASYAVEHDETCQKLGVFTPYGLQLQ